MQGETVGETLEPQESASNLADWLSGMLAQYPAAYAPLSQYLQQVMPDLLDFHFERAGKEAKALLVRFKAGNAQHELDFDALSDGEKCFFLCGVVLAAHQSYGPLFAFWDEPDNYLSLSEVSHFVMALRRGFHQGGGQIWMTSHNEEAVRRFSHDNTWVLGRKSHLEPTLIRPLAELGVKTDVIQALICGELEPVSVNVYQQHVMVLPEDDANRQIVNGFMLDPSLNDRAIQVLPIARTSIRSCSTAGDQRMNPST